MDGKEEIFEAYLDLLNPFIKNIKSRLTQYYAERASIAVLIDQNYERDGWRQDDAIMRHMLSERNYRSFFQYAWRLFGVKKNIRESDSFIIVEDTNPNSLLKNKELPKWFVDNEHKGRMEELKRATTNMQVADEFTDDEIM